MVKKIAIVYKNKICEINFEFQIIRIKILKICIGMIETSIYRTLHLNHDLELVFVL